MSYYITKNDEYLAHHGILGQKWGVRRFQNEDGSLTDAGRKRYYKEWVRQYKSDKLAYTKMPKDIEGMDAIKRLNDDISESLDRYKEINNKIIDTASDYRNNRPYWSAVAGVADALRWQETDMGGIASRINFYVNDDGDQGYMNSLGIWAKEKGKDKVLERLGKEEIDTYKEFESNVKTKVNDILGKYGNKKIEGHATAATTMVNAIINSTEQYASYIADDASWGPTTKSEADSVKTAKNIVAKLSIGKGKNKAWFLNDAVENCGLDDVDFKDMTNSDWSKLSKELSRLSANTHPILE